MGLTPVMQRLIKRRDGRVDPGFRARRAGRHDAREIAVDGDLIVGAQYRPAQAARDVKTLQRKDPAPARVDPVQVGVIARPRHRKQAHRIGAQQKVGGDLVGHGLLKNVRRDLAWDCS